MPEQHGADRQPQTLGELGESGILSEIFSQLLPSRTASPAEIGPGDDGAVHDIAGPVIATTDTMVRGRDWLDRWSTGHDVGVKVVTQNVADIAAMGGVPTGILVTLVAPPDLHVDWVRAFTEGLVEATSHYGVTVLGGDLSSSLAEVSVSVTALGVLAGARPVLRSGAQPGDVVATSGPLGRSAAGWDVLRRSEQGWWPTEADAPMVGQWVGYHCAPQTDIAQGPVAAAHGASAMLDISDGLGRDAGRIAEASGVDIHLDEQAINQMSEVFSPVLGERSARTHVLAGGEEHELLATFADADQVPPGWLTLGRVTSASPQEQDQPTIPAVRLAGEPLLNQGWDHFERHE